MKPENTVGKVGCKQSKRWSKGQS